MIRDLLRSLFSREENEYFNVTALLRNEETGLYSIHRAHSVLNRILGREQPRRSESLHFARNIVTDAGDVHLAQKAAGESPTNAWDTTANSCLYLRSSSASPAKGSTYSATDAIAPTTGLAATVIERNNGDTDNTGKGTEVVTRKYAASTSQFNHATIIGAYIAVASASGGAAVYAVWDFSSFAKTSSDTLTVWHNTDFEGV